MSIPDSTEQTRVWVGDKKQPGVKSASAPALTRKKTTPDDADVSHLKLRSVIPYEVGDRRTKGIVTTTPILKAGTLVFQSAPSVSIYPMRLELAAFEEWCTILKGGASICEVLAVRWMYILLRDEVQLITDERRDCRDDKPVPAAKKSKKRMLSFGPAYNRLSAQFLQLSGHSDQLANTRAGSSDWWTNNVNNVLLHRQTWSNHLFDQTGDTVVHPQPQDATTSEVMERQYLTRLTLLVDRCVSNVPSVQPFFPFSQTSAAGWGVYLWLSWLRRSCHPTCHVVFDDDGQAYVFATRAILANEELTVGWDPLCMIDRLSDHTFDRSICLDWFARGTSCGCSRCFHKDSKHNSIAPTTDMKGLSLSWAHTIPATDSRTCLDAWSCRSGSVFSRCCTVQKNQKSVEMDAIKRVWSSFEPIRETQNAGTQNATLSPSSTILSSTIHQWLHIVGIWGAHYWQQPSGSTASLLLDNITPSAVCARLFAMEQHIRLQAEWWTIRVYLRLFQLSVMYQDPDVRSSLAERLFDKVYRPPALVYSTGEQEGTMATLPPIDLVETFGQAMEQLFYILHGHVPSFYMRFLLPKLPMSLFDDIWWHDRHGLFALHDQWLKSTLSTTLQQRWSREF